MAGKLNKEEIKKLFAELNRKLNKNNQSADILICGGASMTLLYDETIATKDIDGYILTTDIKSEITKYVEQIGGEQNIDEAWFNEAAKGYIDLSWGKEEVINYSNLTVYSVKAEQLLAMKLISARIDTRDDKDAIKLMRCLDIGSSDELLDILEKSYGTWALSAKLQYHTLDLFERFMEEKEMNEKNARETIYIRIPKAFAQKDVPSKKEGQEGKTYNKVTLPSNAKIAGKSVGGFSFYPLYLNEDKFSDKLYNIPLLSDQQIQLNKDGQKIIVKPEEIKASIEQSYNEYARDAKRDMEAVSEYDFAWEGMSFRQYCMNLISDGLDRLEGQSVTADKIGNSIIGINLIAREPYKEPYILLEGTDQCLRFIGHNITEAKEIYDQIDGWLPKLFEEPEGFQKEMTRIGVNNILDGSEYIKENKDKEVKIDKDVKNIILSDVGIKTTKDVSKSIAKNLQKDKGAELE